MVITNNFMSSNGCDSLVNLNLAFANFDTSIQLRPVIHTWNDSTYTKWNIPQLFTNEFGCTAS